MSSSKSTSETVARSRILLALCVVALIGAGLLVRKLRVDAGGSSDSSSSASSGQDAKSYALPHTPDENVELKFLLRRVPINPCDPKKPKEPENRGFIDCTVTMAIDIESGARIVLPPTDDPTTIELPKDVPSPDALRARLLAGELLAVGSIEHKRQRADLHGEAWPDKIDAGGNDAGGKPERDATTTKLDDRVLVVHNTAPVPQKLSPLASAVDLAHFYCPGYAPTAQIYGDANRLYTVACGTLVGIDKKGKGKLERILSSVTDTRLLLDEEHIYASSFGTKRLKKDATQGESFTVVARQKGVEDGHAERACEWLHAMDAKYIYCAGRESKKGVEDGLVFRVPKEGGDAQEIARVDGNVFDVTIDDSNVYYYAWLRMNPSRSPKIDQIIYSVSKEGGPSRVVAQGDGKDLKVVNPSGLTVVGDTLFWANGCNGCPVASVNIKRASPGALEDHLAVGETVIDSFRIDQGDIFAQAHSGDVVRNAVNASARVFTPQNLKKRGQGETSIQIDGSFIYFALPFGDGDHVSILRLPR